MLIRQEGPQKFLLGAGVFISLIELVEFFEKNPIRGELRLRYPASSDVIERTRRLYPNALQRQNSLQHSKKKDIDIARCSVGKCRGQL